MSSPQSSLCICDCPSECGFECAFSPGAARRENSRKSSARVCTGFSRCSNPFAFGRSRTARAAPPYPGGGERLGSAPGAGQVPRRPGGTARCRGVTRKRNGRQRNQFRVPVAVGAGGKRRWERAGPAGIRHVRAPGERRAKGAGPRGGAALRDGTGPCSGRVPAPDRPRGGGDRGPAGQGSVRLPAAAAAASSRRLSPARASAGAVA